MFVGTYQATSTCLTVQNVLVCHMVISSPTDRGVSEPSTRLAVTDVDTAL